MSRKSNSIRVHMNGSSLCMDVLVFARAYTTLAEVETGQRGSRALPTEAESVLAQFVDDPGSIPTYKAVLAAGHPTTQALWPSLFDMQVAIVQERPEDTARILERLNAIRAAHRSGRTVSHLFQLAA